VQKFSMNDGPLDIYNPIPACQRCWSSCEERNGSVYDQNITGHWICRFLPTLAGLGYRGARTPRYGSHRGTPQKEQLHSAFMLLGKIRCTCVVVLLCIYEPKHRACWCLATHCMLVVTWAGWRIFMHDVQFRWHDARAAESLEIHDWWTESASLQLLARNSKVIWCCLN
jgi:hypothetical protein